MVEAEASQYNILSNLHDADISRSASRRKILRCCDSLLFVATTFFDYRVGAGVLDFVWYASVHTLNIQPLFFASSDSLFCSTSFPVLSLCIPLLLTCQFAIAHVMAVIKA